MSLKNSGVVFASFIDAVYFANSKANSNVNISLSNRSFYSMVTNDFCEMVV